VCQDAYKEIQYFRVTRASVRSASSRQPSKDERESVKCVGAGSRRHCIIFDTRAHDERYADSF
jgi:hypothetical protein